MYNITKSSDMTVGPSVLLTVPSDDELKAKFESRFESGNLNKAIKVNDTEYNLLLSYDFNTKGHTQWFYFNIKTKLEAGTKLKFRILNLMKPDSLYNYGMKPGVLSEKHRTQTGESWHRDGENISYSKNDIIRNKITVPSNSNKQAPKRAVRFYFTLEFTYTLRYDNDSVYFAHSYPYTYNDNLRPFLDDLSSNEAYHSFLRIGTLGYTFARNAGKMLVITENVKYYRDPNEELSWMKKSQAARRILRLKSSLRRPLMGVMNNKMKKRKKGEKFFK